MEHDEASLSYVYEVKNIEPGSVDTKSLLPQLKAQFIGKLKTHSTKKLFIENDIVTKSEYLTSDGETILIFSVLPEEYK